MDGWMDVFPFSETCSLIGFVPHVNNGPLIRLVSSNSLTHSLVLGVNKGLQAIHCVECDHQMCCMLFQKILQYHYLFKTKKINTCNLSCSFS